MNNSRFGTLLLGIALIALLLGCNALALSGAKKYKVDLTNVLMKIQDEIDVDGTVSENTFKKFQNLMDKNQEEFGKKGSYQKAKDVLEELIKARSNPENAFYNYQQAKIEMTLCFDLLKTEVAD